MIPKRKHPRLNGWNYSQEGAYFLTLCSKEKKPIFSKIVGRGILDTPETRLLEPGRIVQETLEFIQKQNSLLVLHNWVIMPNHVHILVSVLPNSESHGEPVVQNPANTQIPKFVASLKRFTNRRTGIDLWQTSYYDHIIRDDLDFVKRWRYIDNNPSAWMEDDYYSE